MDLKFYKETKEKFLMSNLKRENINVSENKEYYLICRSGARTASTCYMLREEGYNVINVAGGIISYEGDNIER